MRRFVSETALITLTTLLLAGCATHQTVKDEVAASEQKQTQAVEQLRHDMTTELEQIKDGARTNATKAGKDSARALLMAEDASRAIAELESRFTLRNDLTERKREVVYFGFDRDGLDDTARATLDSIAAFAGQDKNYVVVLEGHTDKVGPDSYNYALSNRRVNGVIRYLVGEKGADLNRIHVIGMGEGYPAADNDSKEGRQQNRRVIIRVLAPR